MGKHQIFNILRKNVIGDVDLETYKNFQVDVLHPQVDELTLVWVTVENNLLEKWEYTSVDPGVYFANYESAEGSRTEKIIIQ